MGKDKVTQLSELSQEELLAKATELQTSNEEAVGTIKKLEATIEELMSLNEIAEKSKNSKKAVVKIGKKTFFLKVPKFHIRYKATMIPVTADVVNKDKELGEWLLKEKPNQLIAID